MCGIVGGIAQRNVVPILLEGLKRLEYRGYDSAGVVVIADQSLQRIRSTGRVQSLFDAAKAQNLRGLVGIGHTRWATHGAPSERNAHPHISDAIAVVHNGIIENHAELRAQLQTQGYVFTSDTDTEVIAHLVHRYYQQKADLRMATQAAVADLVGAFAIGIIHADHPEELICARRGSPLLIGIGIEEHFIASDVAALLPVTQKVIYLEEGDVARITQEDYQIWDAQGAITQRSIHTSELTADVAELGKYRHYMQKEIHEQPKAIADTLEMLSAGLQAELFGVEAAATFANINAVTILACGTSYHSGCVARYWLEEIAGIPCQVEIASEYRYRTSVPNPNALIVTISQSGETADTLAALQHAKSLGQAHTLAICNVPESSLMRQSKLKFLTRAGPEIGVASTKAFTTQLIALYVLTHVIAKQRGAITPEQEASALEALRHTPLLVQQALQVEETLKNWAEQIFESRHALFLGRGTCYPIAMEGALKLKEISYIHAEAYAAGELKHGPLALVDKEMPVIVVAAHDAWLEKLKSNMEEVMARGGILFVLAEAGCQIEPRENLQVLELPAIHAGLSPLLLTIPTQLLAYYTALRKGTDVDKPRNLAKSVTVE